MRFRTRLLATMAGTILLPSLLLGWVVRENMTSRFTEQYDQRGSSLATTVASRLSDMSLEIDARLDILENLVATDDKLRESLLAIDGGLPFIDPYLTRFGNSTARLTGLAVIQLQDDEGLIITSSHNPDDFGRREATMSDQYEMVVESPRPALRMTNFPDELLPTLVRLRTFNVENRKFLFTAGIVINDALWRQLTPAHDFELCLDNAPGSVLQCDDMSASQQAETGIYRIDLLSLDVNQGSVGNSAIVIRQSRRALTELLADIDRWLFIVFGVILAFGLVSMVWVSAKISNPLTDLLYKTSRIDLNRLNVSFKSGRKDEIGDLARVLDEMTRRLRISRTNMREAERKIAIGDVARQVNHDIKNGLTPIRNIIQHFSTAAHNNDPELINIVLEREESLTASILFLEQLAGNYARLSPEPEQTEVELNRLLSELITDYCGSRSVTIDFEPGSSAQVTINDLSFRRVLENLLDNAFDSLSGEGSVRIHTEVRQDLVAVTIIDSGSGMNPDELDDAFKDFHTTKTNGTGLGLSIVRRLIMDMNASMSIESARGKGTTVTLLIPLATQI